MRKLFSALIIFILLITTVNAGKINYTLSWNCGISGILYDSMAPAIQCGDRVIAQTVTPHKEKFIIGDIYCFRPNRNLFPVCPYCTICHRLKYIRGDYLETRGDSNPYSEVNHRRYFAYHIVKIERKN